VLFLHQDDVIKCVPIYLFSHLGKSQIYRCSQPQRSHIHKEVTDRVQEEEEVSGKRTELSRSPAALVTQGPAGDVLGCLRGEDVKHCRDMAL